MSGGPPAEGIGSTPAEFRAFVQDQIAQFRALARTTSISME